jgi:hypothetical protein
MIRTIRTTVRNIRTGDVVVPMRGDAHGMRGEVTYVQAYLGDSDPFVDVVTDQSDAYGLAPDLGVSVRRTYGRDVVASANALMDDIATRQNLPRVTNGMGTVADGAAEYTLRNLGGSFDPYVLAASEGDAGYMVGIGQRGTRSLVTLPQGHGTRRALSAAILDVATVARDVPNGMVGTWIDEGLVYVEVSQWVAGRDEAIELGNAHNQRAIWDVKAGAPIDLTRPATGQWREASLERHIVR